MRVKGAAVWRSLPTPPQLEEAIRSGMLTDPVFQKATAWALPIRLGST
jgi:hypothetical protein